jgi:hypothetical protein
MIKDPAADGREDEGREDEGRGDDRMDDRSTGTGEWGVRRCER